MKYMSVRKPLCLTLAITAFSGLSGCVYGPPPPPAPVAYAPAPAYYAPGYYAAPAYAYGYYAGPSVAVDIGGGRRWR